VGSITTLSALLPPVRGAEGAGPVVLGDTVVSALRDTLRLVRLMFDDPGARQVAVVGDFNGWHAGETPLVRDAATHRWSATLALRDGFHRYAFVVDGTRWTPDPSAERVRADDGRVYSLLHVARTTN
jgi:1,4-alpha-glucan branching enzyme